VPLGTGKTGSGLCLECSDWPQVLSSAKAAYVMEPPADILVHALKYGGWRSLGELMGRRMAEVNPRLPTNDWIVPVPTTLRRQRVRGYNQAQVLGEVVAKALGVPLLGALERPKGGTQVRLGPWERRSNVKGAFKVLSGCGSRIRGSEVILIDDVMTTGATAVSAALALAEEGAKSVRLLTFARALPFGGERTRDPIH
jgi:ComF family protein